MAGSDSIGVYVPSFKRANHLLGKDYFPMAKYVVSEFEAKEYVKAVGKDRVISVPDATGTKLTRTLNYILTRFPRPLLILNDDVKAIVNIEVREYVKLTSVQAWGVILQGFNLAEEWGVKFWGMNVAVDRRFYRVFTPFSLSQVVLGPVQGHFDHPLKFDEDMEYKEDYDFAIQMLNRYRKILRLNKYAYLCEHGDNKGGCVAHRTMAKEQAASQAIMRKWGPEIVRYRTGKETRKVGDLLNGMVHVPIGDV